MGVKEKFIRKEKSTNDEIPVSLICIYFSILLVVLLTCCGYLTCRSNNRSFTLDSSVDVSYFDAEKDFCQNNFEVNHISFVKPLQTPGFIRIAKQHIKKDTKADFTSLHSP